MNIDVRAIMLHWGMGYAKSLEHDLRLMAAEPDAMEPSSASQSTGSICRTIAKPGFQQALDLIAKHTSALGCEDIATLSAQGRHTSQPLYARRDYPIRDVAAMDGYAIRETDIGGASLRLLAIRPPHFAGMKTPAVGPGEALPISTGATVPLGTGAIIISERAVVRDSRLALAEGLTDGMNIRRAGEDARSGELVLEGARKIQPAILGALCAYGIEQVRVRRRPVVAILTSGDELRPVDALGAANVADANGPMIAAMLEQVGCVVRRYPSVDDDAIKLRAAMIALTDEPFDMILTTGGVSVGERDMIPDALDAIGATRHFHGVSMRPGKPALFATLPGGRPFFALPGNPAAALTCARFLVMRAVRAMLDLRSESPLQVASSIEPGVTRILKASRQSNSEGILDAVVLPGQQSHRLRPFMTADSWIVTGGDHIPALYALYDYLDAP